jgi:polysaccharide export outer membrane protein
MRVERAIFHGAAALAIVLCLGACSSAGRLTGPAPSGEGAEVAIGQSVGDNIRVVAALPAPVDASGAVVQRIAPNDILTVDVFRVDELDTTAEVDATGNITLPLVGPVRAAGKTLPELQTDLKRLYGSRYLQNPEITVSMKTSAGQRATLDGEFRRAGIYPTGASTTLIQVIALAGGFTNIADPAKVFVFREVGAERLVAQFNVDRIREGKAPDPRIAGGDVVVAFPSGIRVFGQNLREALGVARSAAGILP